MQIGIKLEYASVYSYICYKWNNNKIINIGKCDLE